jgi:DNA polymerase-1
MSFFFPSVKKGDSRGKQASLDVLRHAGCSACPLNNAPVNSPKMEPHGGEDATYYVLGDAPGEVDDRTGKAFSGPVGKFFTSCIPDHLKQDVRYNNIIRDSTPGGRMATYQEVESCRKYIEKDILATKPQVIFAVGTALSWFNHYAEPNCYSGVGNWRGRYFPIKIRNHYCWVAPLMHPTVIMQKAGRRSAKDTDLGRTFKSDVEAGLRLVGISTKPVQMLDNKRISTVLYPSKHQPLKPKDIMEWIESILDDDYCAIDLETNGLRPYAKMRGKNDPNLLTHFSYVPKILSIAITSQNGRTLSIPLGHKDSMYDMAEYGLIDTQVRRLLEQPTLTKIAHNLSFELEWLSVFYGNEILRNNSWGDTMVLQYLLDERRSGLGLDFLTKEHFGFSVKNMSDIDVKDLENTDISKVLEYNALDAVYTLRLYQHLYPRLEEEGLVEVYNENIRRIPTMVLTQQVGLLIDTAKTEEFALSLGIEELAIQHDIDKLPCVAEFKKKTGTSAFNPMSNPQLGLLYKEVLGRDEVVTDSGSTSVGEDILKEIDDELAQLTLRLRHITKLKSTYVDIFREDYEKSVIYADGRAHTILNTMFTTTGRLSSEQFNTQNFPKRKDAWTREQIIAPEGHILLAVDYGQIEARVIGMASKDKYLCDALFNNYDIHMEWAEKVAYAYPQKVGGVKMLKDKDAMKEFRGIIKNKFVFPAFYGASVHAVSGYLELDNIKELFDEFWDTFSEVYDWQQKLIRDYNKNGYVETLTGRRRRQPLTSNQLINMPVQGTASDIVVDSMNRLSEFGQVQDNFLSYPVEGISCYQPIMNIHDDLTFYIPTKNTDEYFERIIGMMIDVPFDFINVPISVEAQAGSNWYEMEDIGTFQTGDM